jgi:hypothetical protein
VKDFEIIGEAATKVEKASSPWGKYNKSRAQELRARSRRKEEGIDAIVDNEQR